MASFQYEWWNVDVDEPTGRLTIEVKAKNKAGAIRQINKLVAQSNSAENLAQAWYKQIAPIKAVYWETLRLDRVGHQRLY